MIELKPVACTIRIFGPDGGETIDWYVLPVDSPDAEHAAASILAHEALSASKTDGDGVRSVAFYPNAVEPRR